MRETGRIVLVALLACLVLCASWAEAETTAEPLTEYRLDCSGLPKQISSIDAACVLNDDTLAFATQDSAFFYHFAADETTRTDLHHPKLTAKSDLSILTILPFEENTLVLPVYDYQAEKSYCVLMDRDKETILAYSAPTEETFACAAVHDGQLILGGSVLHPGKDVRRMSSWYCVMNASLEVVFESTLTSTLRTDASSMAEVSAIFVLGGTPVLAEYLRQDDQVSLWLNQIGTVGQILRQQALTLPEQADTEALQKIVLRKALPLSSTACRLYGELQHGGENSSFLCTLDEQLQITDFEVLDHALIMDMFQDDAGLFALTITDDYSTYGLMDVDSLHSTWQITQRLTEEESSRNLRFLLPLGQEKWITMGIWHAPDQGGRGAYIGVLQGGN